MKAQKFVICLSCNERSARIRPRSLTGDVLWFCMECARRKGKLKAEDYDPEPEGFSEFIELGTKGSHA